MLSNHDESLIAAAAAGNNNRNHSGGRNFPARLHFMITEAEKDGLDHIVSWQPHGRCFLVHKQKQFVDILLARWFTQTQYQSFQRQCNLYGFRRITRGPDKGAYFHELFLRGKPFLTEKIRRIKIKGNGRRKAANPEAEPDFYSMPWLPSSSNLAPPLHVPPPLLSATATHNGYNALMMSMTNNLLPMAPPLPAMLLQQSGVAVPSLVNNTNTQALLAPVVPPPLNGSALLEERAAAAMMDNPALDNHLRDMTLLNQQRVLDNRLRDMALLNQRDPYGVMAASAAATSNSLQALAPIRYEDALYQNALHYQGR